MCIHQELHSANFVMAGNLSMEERKWIIKQYWKTENAEEVRKRWMQEFGTPSPSRQAIYSIRDKFENTGSVCNAPKSGRPTTANTDGNQMLVSQTYVENPEISKQRASLELNISRRSLTRIMADLGLKMYRPRLFHGLLEDDPDRRLQFCETILDEERHGNGIIETITWSDESHFKLSGAVNRHNCVYYSTENPHWTIERHLNQPGITVWAAMSCKGVLGPIFFDTSLTHDRYLNMLREFVLPELKRQHDKEDFFFQQDGAPPHYALAVRTFLDEELPNRWIGRRGPLEWPPRSPDLTPMDFFFWGIVKDKVFARRPSSIEDMVQYIKEACEVVNNDKELCTRVCLSVAGRLQECVNNEGLQFEHQRDLVD